MSAGTNRGQWFTLCSHVKQKFKHKSSITRWLEQASRFVEEMLAVAKYITALGQKCISMTRRMFLHSVSLRSVPYVSNKD